MKRVRARLNFRLCRGLVISATGDVVAATSSKLTFTWPTVQYTRYGGT
jgi:hypothetical protein